MSLGIPVKLLHEAEGHTATVELKNNTIYRGLLTHSEDNMNCQMSKVVVTGQDGRQTKMEFVFIRGSQIKFIIVPDMLKTAPMFKKVVQMVAKEGKAADAKAAKGGGRGRGRGKGRGGSICGADGAGGGGRARGRS